jgi:ABC-type multidrug transport system permease subunit
MATSRPTMNVPAQGKVLPAFAWIGWRWISRNPASTIAPILLPFIFLYFLHLISPAGLFPLEILGAMIFTTTNIGSWVLGDSATWRIELGLQDLFIASPLDKVRYLFGIAFSNLIPAAPALVILAFLLQAVTPVPLYAWPVLVGALVVLWVLFSAIGIALSSRLGSYREVWPVGNLLFTTLGLLSPIYYPISALPVAWQDIARFLPATYAALLAQGIAGVDPQSTYQLGLEALILVVSAAVGTVLALRLYRWRAP